MLPSSALRKFKSQTTGEGDFLAGVTKSLEVARSVEEGMNSYFGAATIASLDNLERAAYATLANTPTWRKDKLLKAQTELKTAQYIKTILMSYVSSVDVLEEQIKDLYGEYE